MLIDSALVVYSCTLQRMLKICLESRKRSHVFIHSCDKMCQSPMINMIIIKLDRHSKYLYFPTQP